MINGLKEFIIENTGHALSNKDLELYSTVYDIHPLYIDGELVLISSLSINATGVVHMHMICRPNVLKLYPISTARHLHKLNKFVETEYKARRIELDIKADSKKDRNFAEFFGFHEESLMPMFGKNGETYAKYVRLTNG